MSQNWTLERERELRQLWHEGLSASTIARQLGGVSRDAVRGKAWRLNLPAREPGFSQATQESRAKRPEPLPEPEPAGAPNAPAAHCQWIFGDAPSAYVFCTAPKRRGSSWCKAHHQRVYVARPLDGNLPRRRA